MSWRNIVVLAAIFIAGCTFSKQPLFNERDAIFEPALVGEWVSVRWEGHVEALPVRIERGRGNSYRGTCRFPASQQANMPQITNARLGKIGPHYIIDVTARWPDQPEATHSFFKVMFVGRSVATAELGTWFRGGTNAKPDELAHEWKGSSLLLTASTADLQKFFAAHPDEIFDKPAPTLEPADSNHALPVGEGLTGRTQRTLDYWFILRCVVTKDLFDPGLGDPPKAGFFAERYAEFAGDLSRFPADGADEQLLKCAAQLLVYAREASSTYDPCAPLAPGALPALLKKGDSVLADLEKCGADLSAKYKAQFQPVTDFARFQRLARRAAASRPTK